MRSTPKVHGRNASRDKTKHTTIENTKHTNRPARHEGSKGPPKDTPPSTHPGRRPQTQKTDRPHNEEPHKTTTRRRYRTVHRSPLYAKGLEPSRGAQAESSLPPKRKRVANTRGRRQKKQEADTQSRKEKQATSQRRNSTKEHKPPTPFQRPSV